MNSNSKGRKEFYIYEPLDPSDKLSIRLLTLEPGVDPNRIDISLKSSTLEDSLDFDALSYVWGDEKKPNTIYVESKKLNVTANLYGALLRFRDAVSPRILWIDAICIDQENIPERNQQVQIMRSIYKSARKVLIWLGNQEETDGLALMMIERFAKEREVLDQKPEGLKTFIELIQPLAVAGAPEWLALSKLLLRPYFSRIWTIQEVCVSKEPLVVCGPHTFPWEALANITTYIRDNRLTPFLGTTEYVTGCISVPFIHEHRQILKTLGPGTVLLDLLIRTMASCVTDPRDRVFALLGIAELNHELANPGVKSPYSSIKIDYSLSCQEVYISAAKQTLLEAMELCILASAGVKCEASTTGLPSWVPDWNFWDTSYAMPILAFVPHFKFAGDSKPNISVSEDNRILTVEGCALDIIARVGNKARTLMGPGDSALSIETQQRQSQERLEVLQECEAIICGDIPEAQLPVDYWRFLVCDLNHGFQPAPPEFAEAYELYRYATVNFRAYFSGGEAQVVHTISNIKRNALYQRFTLLHQQWTRNRVPYRTDTGFFGWVPRGTEVGDRICMFKGSSVPFVIRPVDEKCEQWKLIGEVYLHYFMRAGAMGDDVLADIEWFQFHIV